MTRKLFFLLIISLLLSRAAVADTRCEQLWGWLTPGCERVIEIYDNGRDQLIVSGWTWHDRSTYSQEKIKTFQEFAYGGGWGYWRDHEDYRESIFLSIFADSHNDPQTTLAYDRMYYWGNPQGWRLGAGYMIALISRSDIFTYLPFPVIWPIGELRYQNLAVVFTAIPGLKGKLNQGNVFYMMAKWQY